MPGRVIDLAAPPSIGLLLARAVATSAGRPGAEAGLPDREVRLAGLRQDPTRLADYDHLCGFTLRDRVPPTWLHVLTFPLQAWLMAERDFPFRLAGLVHVRNEMALTRPVTVTDTLELACSTENLRPHRRGVTFDLVGRVEVDGEPAWWGRSTYLATGAAMAGEPAEPVRAEEPRAEPSAEWRLPADLGRRYARVSGDVNPIHLSPLTSRLFGFRRPLAHGMWTHARALASLEPRLPATYGVQVQFTKPVMLPARLTFGATPGSAPTFVVGGRADKVHLVGTVTTAS